MVTAFFMYFSNDEKKNNKIVYVLYTACLYISECTCLTISWGLYEVFCCMNSKFIH